MVGFEKMSDATVLGSRHIGSLGSVFFLLFAFPHLSGWLDDVAIQTRNQKSKVKRMNEAPSLLAIIPVNPAFTCIFFESPFSRL